jgi:CspA family cold shock protein
MRGQIARVVMDKGFGFIKGSDGVERFFHRSSVLNVTFEELREGQEVEFEHEHGDKGPRANQVTVR